MNGQNNWTGIGNLGAAPTLRKTQTGKTVMKFRMACSRRWKDSNGDLQETTNWVPVVVWEKQAEALAKVLHRGALVSIEGELTSSNWTDKDNKPRTTLEVRAKRVLILPSASRATAQPSLPPQ